MNNAMISEDKVADEVARMEAELEVELAAGTLSVERLRGTVDACFRRLDVVADRRMYRRLKEKLASGPVGLGKPRQLTIQEQCDRECAAFLAEVNAFAEGAS